MLNCEGVLRLVTVAIVCPAVLFNKSTILYDVCSFQKASTAEVQCLCGAVQCKHVARAEFERPFPPDFSFFLLYPNITV